MSSAHVRALTAGLVVAMALACASPGIEGRVVDGYTDAPVPGHIVTLAGTTTSATTGDDGRYAFHDLATGLQRLEPMDGYLVAKPLEVNVPDGDPVQAADLVVYTLPDRRGFHLVRNGVPEPLKPSPERSYTGKGGPFTPGNRYCCWFDLEVEATMPELRDGDVIVRRVDAEAVKNERVEFHRVEHKDAFVRSYRNAATERLPERLAIADAANPASFVPIAGDLQRLDLGTRPLSASVPPGMYMLRVRVATGFLQECVTSYPFRVPAQPATLDGDRLVVQVGTYNGGSQQWALAKERVVAWCAAGGSSDCEAGLRAFEHPTTSGAFPQCEVRFVVTPKKAELSSGGCSGGRTATASFVKADSGYALDALKVEEIGGGEGPPD